MARPGVQRVRARCGHGRSRRPGRRPVRGRPDARAGQAWVVGQHRPVEPTHVVRARVARQAQKLEALKNAAAALTPADDLTFCELGKHFPEVWNSDACAMAAHVRHRSEEGQREGRPLLQEAARVWTHGQDPAHAPSVRQQLRPQRGGHVVVPARAPIPHCLHHCSGGLHFVAKDKGLTTKESVARSGGRGSAPRSRLPQDRGEAGLDRPAHGRP